MAILDCSTINDEGGVDAIFDAINANTRKLKRPLHYSAFSSALTYKDQTDPTTYCQLIMLPVEFSAVRIGFPHLGGNGGALGLSALVAVTDDVGDLSYTNTTEGKKFITPNYNGVEYVDISEHGWTKVTWQGADSVDVEDAGEDKTKVVYSDVIDLQSIPLNENSTTSDKFTGKRALLVRFYGGTAAFTRSQLDGLTSEDYISESDTRIVMTVSRNGEDFVIDPTRWVQSQTPTFPDTITLPIIVEAFTPNKEPVSVLMVGDSRLASAPASESVKGYKNLQWRLERELVDSGIEASYLSSCKGGITSEQYYNWSDQILSGDVHPTDSVYLIYSINDGLPNDSRIAKSKARALRHLNRCVDLGIKVTFITSFPYDTGYSSEDLVLLQELDLFAKSTGASVISPLEIYGDSNGGWLSGFNEDSNHMTPQGQDDLASRIKDLIIN